MTGKCLAANKGHLSVVQILLKAGCDLDVQDDVSRNHHSVGGWLSTGLVCIESHNVYLAVRWGRDSSCCSPALLSSTLVGRTSS